MPILHLLLYLQVLKVVNFHRVEQVGKPQVSFVLGAIALVSLIAIFFQRILTLKQKRDEDIALSLQQKQMERDKLTGVRTTVILALLSYFYLPIDLTSPINVCRGMEGHYSKR